MTEFQAKELVLVLWIISINIGLLTLNLWLTLSRLAKAVEEKKS